MASELPTSHLGGSVIQSEVRIVLLGDTRADLAKVAHSICHKTGTVQGSGLCHLYRGEEALRKILVVVAPGWNRSSIQQTGETVKAEIVRSVSLCPPGPDALLLVLPVKDLSNEPSTSEITEAQNHVELMSERVWKYTIVLFDCDEGVEESAIQERICKAGKILEKCGGRFHVLHRNASQISELFKKIELLVKENKDFFLPQDVYEVIQRKTEVIQRKPEVLVESAIRQRRGSLEKDRPSLGNEKEDSDKKKETAEVAKPVFLALDKSLIPFLVILMAIIGALIGSVAGAEHGVLGACAGLVSGIIVGVLLAILIMYIYTLINSHFNSNQH
ncbi:hypothetical protein E1301_Tti009319 [Triplophysa tibetana]|uniref:AIG1-type G domain-containing protein n=1 Tax=Triplophysa tibetana TaxID=1572043 RepID=A0A5A9NWT7_9TELE|nr:hypothetical protein E1301_Tti009319 [Triplophysa tibetana]